MHGEANVVNSAVDTKSFRHRHACHSIEANGEGGASFTFNVVMSIICLLLIISMIPVKSPQP